MIGQAHLAQGTREAETVEQAKDKGDHPGPTERQAVGLTPESLGEVERSFAECGFADFRSELEPAQHPMEVATHVIFLYATRVASLEGTIGCEVSA